VETNEGPVFRVGVLFFFYLHHAVLTFEKVWPLTNVTILKICSHFQKWHREKYTVVNGQLRVGKANLTELRGQISKI